MKKIGLASDHAGFEMKELLVGYLDALGLDVHDFGCMDTQSCDYADFGHALAEAVAGGVVDCGVAVCGSGLGMSISVNRHKGVRGALCFTEDYVRLAREHNDANILVLGARFIGNDEATRFVDLFLGTSFEGGRHGCRIEKLDR